MSVNQCLYSVDPTEPSIFTGIRDSISLDWICWYAHFKKTGVKSASYPVSEAVMINSTQIKFEELFGVSTDTYALIQHSLEVHKHEYHLSDVPPPMYVENDKIERKTLSMAWIMDTCIRDNMTPIEATTLAYALAKM